MVRDAQRHGESKSVIEKREKERKGSERQNKIERDEREKYE